MINFTISKHFFLIFTEKSIVTSAHCVIEIEPKSIEIHGCQFSACSKDEIMIIQGDQTDIIPYPNFDSLDKINDIAVINLKTALNFTDEFFPIDFPMNESNSPEELTFPDWSHDQVGKLNSLTLQVHSPEKCFILFNGIVVLNHKRSCAGYKSKFLDRF